MLFCTVIDLGGRNAGFRVWGFNVRPTTTNDESHLARLKNRKWGDAKCVDYSGNGDKDQQPGSSVQARV